MTALWKKEDNRVLTSLRQRGMSLPAIASRMGRSTDIILGRMVALGIEAPVMPVSIVQVDAPSAKAAAKALARTAQAEAKAEAKAVKAAAASPTAVVVGVVSRSR